ncbi:MAG: helix-turn-helix transcriptional regulator, partial [Thermoanaerobaculia bacterium]
MPRADRLFELVHILGGPRRWSLQELIEHFDVSERTLYRDLDTLGMCGIPIIRLDGRYSLLDGFRLRPMDLTAEEHALLKLALDSPILGKSRALARRLADLETKLDDATCPNEETVTALAVASRDRTGRMLPGLIPALETAIADARAVRMLYVSLSGRTERWRGLDPYRLVELPRFRGQLNLWTLSLPEPPGLWERWAAPQAPSKELWETP